MKREFAWKPSDEFHFKTNSDSVRERFIKEVVRYNFFYYAIVLNKKKLYGEGFSDKQSFYKYACGLVFESAKEKLDNATVVIDQSGNLEFRGQLDRYLKQKMNSGDIRKIKSVKMQRSTSNNLLQLADYIAGIITRYVSGKKKNASTYRNMISHRQIRMQIWPPQ